MIFRKCHSLCYSSHGQYAGVVFAGVPATLALTLLVGGVQRGEVSRWLSLADLPVPGRRADVALCCFTRLARRLMPSLTPGLASLSARLRGAACWVGVIRVPGIPMAVIENEPNYRQPAL